MSKTQIFPFGYHLVQNRLVHVSTVWGRNPKGPSIAFIHGLGATGGSWMPLIKELRKRASRFIYFDIPPHGLSPAPKLPYTFKDAYQLTHDVLIREIEPGERTILIGNSLGGAFAMKFAVEEPDYISRAILISPAGAPFPTSAYDVLAQFLPHNMSEARQVLHKIFVEPSVGVDLLTPGFFNVTTSPAFHALIKSMLEYDTDPESDIRKLILKPEELQNCKTPIQLIWGKKDAVLPAGMRDYYDKYLPESSARLYPETFGHCPQFEEPAALAALLNLD